MRMGTQNVPLAPNIPVMNKSSQKHRGIRHIAEQVEVAISTLQRNNCKTKHFQIINEHMHTCLCLAIAPFGV